MNLPYEFKFCTLPWWPSNESHFWRYQTKGGTNWTKSFRRACAGTNRPVDHSRNRRREIRTDRPARTPILASPGRSSLPKKKCRKKRKGKDLNQVCASTRRSYYSPCWVVGTWPSVWSVRFESLPLISDLPQRSEEWWWESDGFPHNEKLEGSGSLIAVAAGTVNRKKAIKKASTQSHCNRVERTESFGADFVVGSERELV